MEEPKIFQAVDTRILKRFHQPGSHVNRTDIAKRVSVTVGMPLEQLEFVIRAWLTEIEENLKRGNTVKIQGLGTFSTKQIGRKKYRLPDKTTGISPARAEIGFKPSERVCEILTAIQKGDLVLTPQGAWLGQMPLDGGRD